MPSRFTHRSPAASPSLDAEGRSPDPFDRVIGAWRRGDVRRRAIVGADLARAVRVVRHASLALTASEALLDDRAPMPFFCRSGSVGSQRTPCHWVGDTPSTWDGLRGALTACLSLSLSGFALASHDAGGFYTSKRQALIPATLLDGGEAEFVADVDPELYGRWAQWAALSPVARFHGLGRREPTAYPEPWRSAAIEALRPRRRLLPFLRAALDDARATGMPVMRPPILTHPEDADARLASATQYTLGPDVLVAPREFPVWARRGSMAAKVATI